MRRIWVVLPRHINSPAGSKGAPAGCISSAGPDRPLNPDFRTSYSDTTGGSRINHQKTVETVKVEWQPPLAGRRRWPWQWSRSAGVTNKKCKLKWDIQLSVISSNCNFMYPVEKVDLESSRGVLFSLVIPSELTTSTHYEYSLRSTYSVLLYGQSME